MTERCRVCGKEIPDGCLDVGMLVRFHERLHVRDAQGALFRAAKAVVRECSRAGPSATGPEIERLADAVAEVERIERLLMPELHKDLDKLGASG